MAKVRRLGVAELSTYYLAVEQHPQFFMAEKVHLLYVDYWNDKLKMFRKDKGHWSVVVEVMV